MRRPSLSGLLLLTIGLGAPALAGDDDDKHENWFGEVDPLEVQGVELKFEKVHAQRDFAQVWVKIKNDSGQYLEFHREAAKLMFDFGAYGLDPAKKGHDLIEPGKKHKQRYKVYGSTEFHDADSFTFQPDGFFLVDPQGTAVQASGFSLPASRNTFSAGPLECSLLEFDPATDRAMAEFRCDNSSKDYAFIDLRKISVQIEGAGEFANVPVKNKRGKKGGGVILVAPGKNATFVTWFVVQKQRVDTQFANMRVQWNDAFSVSSPRPLAFPQVSFELDPELTAEKNE